jgi:hypothetical protein
MLMLGVRTFDERVSIASAHTLPDRSPVTH